LDKEYWKKRYKDKWEEGNRREEIVKTLLESWGFEVVNFGFEALSTQYNPDSPDEKGKPDFFIEYDKNRIFFEVTGTSVGSVTPEAQIWLRPDKVEYVKKHEVKAYCIHVLDKYELIRFIDMHKIIGMKLIHPTIRGTRETYYEIDPSEWGSEEDLKKILLASYK